MKKKIKQKRKERWRKDQATQKDEDVATAAAVNDTDATATAVIILIVAKWSITWFVYLLFFFALFVWYPKRALEPNLIWQSAMLLLHFFLVLAFNFAFLFFWISIQFQEHLLLRWSCFQNKGWKWEKSYFLGKQMIRWKYLVNTIEENKVAHLLAFSISLSSSFSFSLWSTSTSSFFSFYH